MLHDEILGGVAPGARIADETGETTGAALLDEARRAAEALRAAGAGAWEPVILPVSNRASDLAAMLGAMAAGCVAVPLSRAASPATREAVLSLVGPRFALDLAAGEPLERIGERPPPPRQLLEGAALVIFTSGSTGAPKGVVIGAEGFRGKLAQIEARLGWAPGGRTILPLQLTFIFGQWVAFLTLMRGGSLRLVGRFDPGAMRAALAAGEADALAAVPTMLRAMLAAGGEPVPAPLLLMTGGETLSPALGAALSAAFPAARIADLYGLSETNGCDFFNAGERFAANLGTLGEVAPGQEARIDAETGELQIRTPWLMRGYLDRPDLTEAALADGWLRTGDMAEIAPSGAVRLVGRLKEIINRGGNKVAPMEVEAAFAAHPEIAACLATGAADAARGEAIHLLVVPAPGAAPDPAALRDWARGRLEPWKLPDRIHIGEAIPLGATGKADRLGLRRRIEAREL